MRKAHRHKTDFIGTDGEISMTGLSEMTYTPDELQRVTPYGVSITTMTIEATLPKYLPTTSGGHVMPAEKGIHLLKTLEADCSGASDKKGLVTAMLITEHIRRGIIGTTHTTTETIRLNNIERGFKWDTTIMTIGSPWNLHAKLLRTYLQPFLPPLDGVSYLIIIRFIFHKASSFRRGTPIGQRSHSVRFAIPVDLIDAFLSRVEKNPKKFLAFTEGNSDRATLELAGIPTIAIPSAASGAILRRMGEWATSNNKILVACSDNDKAGSKLLKSLDGVAPYIDARPQGYKDYNEMYQAEGMAAIERSIGWLKN